MIPQLFITQKTVTFFNGESLKKAAPLLAAQIQNGLRKLNCSAYNMRLSYNFLIAD